MTTQHTDLEDVVRATAAAGARATARGVAANDQDGPEGLRQAATPAEGISPVLLARTSGAPITAFYVAVKHAWVLNTWDDLVIPKPFSPALVRVARKISVPADADDAAMEKYHAEMQAALERITEFAEAQFRVEG